MNKSKCPECRQKLGSYRYADACPHCGKPLEHNNVTRFTTTPPKTSVLAGPLFPFPLFRWVVRFVES